MIMGKVEKKGRCVKTCGGELYGTYKTLKVSSWSHDLRKKKYKMKIEYLVEAKLCGLAKILVLI